MVEKLLKNYLEEIEDDYDFLQFLILEEKFSYSFDHMYGTLSEMSHLIDFEYETDTVKDIYDNFQRKVLKEFNKNINDLELNELLEVVGDIIGHFDHSKKLQKYIATRLMQMSPSTINYFLTGINYFQRTTDLEAWHNNERINDVLKRKISNMDVVDLTVLLASTPELFYEDSIYSESLYANIEKMDDLEFSFFRRAIYFNHDLDNYQLNEIITNKGYNISSPILYLSNLTTNNNKSYERILNANPNFNEFDFLFLTKDNKNNFKYTLKYIKNNYTILLYMLANPSTFLKKASRMNGIKYPFRNIAGDLKKSLIEKVKDFSQEELKILLAAASCYEDSRLNQEIEEVIKNNFSNYDLTIDNKYIYIAKNISELATSLSHVTLIPRELKNIDDYTIQDTDLQNEVQNKRLFVDCAFDLFKYHTDIFTKCTSCNLIDLILSLYDNNTIEVVDDSLLLTNYIKYRIITEKDKNNLYKLLLLDWTKLPPSFIKYINTCVISNKLLKYPEELEDNNTKKKTLQ